jgi:hypothetical protein
MCKLPRAWNCVNDIKNWMSKDKLLMNDDKTEFLIIGTRPQLEKVDLNCISTRTVDISPSNSPIKSLGVWLDRNLSMD